MQAYMTVVYKCWKKNSGQGVDGGHAAFFLLFLCLRQGVKSMDIYIVTGFTGAGKTTFFNKYIPLFSGKTAVIENELGEVELSPELFGEENLVSELSSGCICCTLAVNLEEKLHELEAGNIEKVFLEPSGVSRLSDIVKICGRLRKRETSKIQTIRKITLVDISMAEAYLEDFGEFYTDQIECADVILFSCIDEASEEEREKGAAHISSLNSTAVLYTGDWRELSGVELKALIEKDSCSDDNRSVSEEESDDSVMVGISDRGIRKKRLEYQIKFDKI